MKEAEMMQVDFEAARICKGILSGDSDLVDSFLRTVPVEYLCPIYNKVVHKLSTDVDTSGLDMFMKKELSAKRSNFMQLFSDVQRFNYERKRIDRDLIGYPKYQAMMNLYGKDPKSYHEWTDMMASLSAVR